MKQSNVAPITSAKSFDTGAFKPEAAGATFAVAIEETGQAIYMALENVARGIECNYKGDEMKEALKAFLAGFDAAFYAANVKRKTSIMLARTKSVTLSDAVKIDIEASAKNLTKSTKSLYKSVLEIRLFKNGGTISQNARDYKTDHELSINGNKDKKANKKKESESNGVINTAELCKTIAGFDMLLNAVIDGGINSGNPEVIAKAESIKAFIAGVVPTAKKKPGAKKAPGIGDMLLAASA